MCVIALVPADIKVKKERFRNCFDFNPDGAGFMYQDKKNNQVIIRKGFMNFDNFWDEFSRISWKVDRVAHFRIATSGKIDQGCCHPFPLAEDYKDMRKVSNKARVAVAHNGVIHWTEPKDKLKAIYSDSMAFIANYLFKMKPMLFTPEFGDIIDHATNGKFAIMDANRVSLIGDFQMCDGVFYSNDSYESYTHYYWNKYDKYYEEGNYMMDKEDYDDTELDMMKQGFFRIAFSVKDPTWKLAAEMEKQFEKAGAFVDEYWIGSDVIVFNVDTLPKYATFCGRYWYRTEGNEEEMDDDDCNGNYRPLCEVIQCKFTKDCKERKEKEDSYKEQHKLEGYAG